MSVMSGPVRDRDALVAAGSDASKEVRSTDWHAHGAPAQAESSPPPDRDWWSVAPGALEHPGVKMAKGFLDTLVRALQNRAEVRALDEPERLRLEVVQLYEEGRLHEAELAARRLVDLLDAAVGRNHPDHAAALSNLALLLQKQGDLDAAEPLLRQVAAVRSTTLGANHPDHATALNNLALLLCERHNLDAAEPLLRQVLDIRRESVGEQHADYATGLSSLALLLCERHDLAGAEPLLRQAVEIRRLALGREHPDHATSLNNLGLLLCERQNPSAAEPLLRQALEIRRAVLGDDHPDTASTAEALAAAAVKLVERDVTNGRPTTTPTIIAAPPIAAPRVEPDDQPPPSAPSSPPRNVEALVAAVDELRTAFAHASEGLLHEAAQMQGKGLLCPEPAPLSAASTCRRTFLALRDELTSAAATLGVPVPRAAELDGLESLAALAEAAVEAERAGSMQAEVRSKALDVLDHIEALDSGDADDREHLDACQVQARTLRGAITAQGSRSLPDEAEQLAAGTHALAALLAIIHDEEDADPDHWTEQYNATVAAFGRPLAIAAARGRLRARDRS